MQALQVLDIKPFMQFILKESELDQYDFVSGEIHTDASYTIDGHLHHNFFSEDELAIQNLTDATYLPWSMGREKIFQLIKGKKTPSYMKIVLRLSSSSMKELIADHPTFTEHDIDGMFLNILFQEQKLNVICGISYKIFSMDKNLENDLTSKISTLLKSNNITIS